MLITRRIDESIVIGENAVVTVIEISPGKVVLGVQAPPEVSIHRKEALEAKKRIKNPDEGQA